jgi:hypothetical protein
MGLILFIATKTAGRSSVMLAVLIISLVMLGNELFSKVMVYAGILASIFLLAGDFSVGVQSDMITILFGIGYVHDVVFCPQVLFRLGSGAAR